MPRTLRILSGGAAQGLVGRVQAAFEQQHGCRIQASFGAAAQEMQCPRHQSALMCADLITFAHFWMSPFT